MGDGRRLGFAQFGKLNARPYFWLHGTPGARRQIPPEARELAEDHEMSIIGIDRPGVGSSTPYRYENILEFTGDLLALADSLDIDEFGVIGLSGGGPTAWPPPTPHPTAARSSASWAASHRPSARRRSAAARSSSPN